MVFDRIIPSPIIRIGDTRPVTVTTRPGIYGAVDTEEAGAIKRLALLIERNTWVV